MIESVRYKGCHVRFDVGERTFGNWHWFYTIDDRSTFGSYGRGFPTRELAAIEAMDEARLRIDRTH